MNYPDLSGKSAVVTGAGGGIGCAIAAALHAQGCRVVATDLDVGALAQAMRARNLDGIECRAHDVTDAAASQALADAVAQHDGTLDIWVNNAGYMQRMPALDMHESAWQRTLDTNLKGAFFGAQAAARHMLRQGSGAIVNLSSYAGVKARPNCIDYAVSKAGIAHMTQCLALEWGQYGIRVNAVAPGYIDAPMSAWIKEDAQIHQAFINRLPIARVGESSEVADAVLFLASQASGYVTGHVLLVDGGASKA